MSDDFNSDSSDMYYLYSEAFAPEDSEVKISPNDTSYSMDNTVSLRTSDMFSSTMDMMGGKPSKSDKNDNSYSATPKGGFPHIYVYKSKSPPKSTVTKERKFGTSKSTVSITDILNQKKMSLNRTSKI
jgi:hypothetical protein